MTKGAENSTSVGDNSTRSDGENRKNKCSGERSGAGTRDKVAEKGLICYGHK